ncbi:MAG: peptidoglycan editing factor PgeF [Pseudomonadota bacterium]
MQSLSDAPWPADWLRPAFSSPRVGAVMTTRAGGVSRAPWDSMNLRDEVSDDPQAVRQNRTRLHAAIGRSSVLLAQVHGADVLTLEHLPPGAEQALSAERVRADGCATAASARACEIQVADCLPVLFADRLGRAVGAAHAGWRGLAAGVLEATLARVCHLAGAAPHEIECWLGPCIGPMHFEVGPEVVTAFLGPQAGERSVFHQPSPGGLGRSMLDLAALGRERLRRASVAVLNGNDSSLSWCTRNDPARYFSYRHSACTGRMAALIWLERPLTSGTGA